MVAAGVLEDWAPAPVGMTGLEVGTTTMELLEATGVEEGLFSQSVSLREEGLREGLTYHLLHLVMVEVIRGREME